MGRKVLYRRELNIGFLIGDASKLYPFQVGKQREQIDQISSNATLDLKNTKDEHGKSDPEKIMKFMQFGDYLRCTPWQSESGSKTRFKEWEKIYFSNEIIFGQQIIDSGLTKFRLTGKDARHPDTLDFLFNVLIDIDKSCEVRKISYDYKDSESEYNEFAKEIFNQWDDAEYRIAYQKAGAGFLSKFFDPNGGLVNGPSIRRSEIESIHCGGTHEIFIETKHNTHVISYQK